MLQKEEILTTLKKYGYYSLNRAPFLYQENDKLGIYFVWPHKHYGNLERVLYFETIEEVEKEVFQYWWFMNNKDKYFLEVNFDNYEVVNPKVTYLFKGNILTFELMQSFDENTVFVDPKETIKKRQLLRTASILILILKEKIKNQNNIYNRVIEMAENLRLLQNEYQKKLNLYKKGYSEPTKNLELLKEDQDEVESLLKKLYAEMEQLETIEDIRGFINTMYQYLINLESSTSAIQNNYLNQRYPLEIEDIRKKISILNEVINEKKKLFQAKQDPITLLSTVDNLSPCNKMIDCKTYIEKEKAQIKEKYLNREKIDENVLGDYLVSFEKLSISLPPIIESNYYDEFDKEDLVCTLKNIFGNLSQKEQSACYVASSFLRECLCILIDKNADQEINLNEIISQLVLENKIHLFNEAYTILDHYNNAKIRVKYFGILKIKNFETFLHSLLEVIRILKELKITLNKSFYGYYINQDKTIINLYLKNIVHLNKKKSFIARFMPNVTLFYSPITIARQLDILNNNELVERENDTIFLLQETVAIKSNKQEIKVVYFEKEKVSQDGYLIVHSLKEKNKCCFFEDRIYNKEDGGLYE